MESAGDPSLLGEIADGFDKGHILAERKRLTRKSCLLHRAPLFLMLISFATANMQK